MSLLPGDGGDDFIILGLPSACHGFVAHAFAEDPGRPGALPDVEERDGLPPRRSHLPRVVLGPLEYAGPPESEHCTSAEAGGAQGTSPNRNLYPPTCAFSAFSHSLTTSILSGLMSLTFPAQSTEAIESWAGKAATSAKSS